jgi:CHAD domain-containing protein
MKRRPTIEQLCAKHHNENAHTEHVTRLGLAIFDWTRRKLRIPIRDRRLLKAACLLHDVGYFQDSVNHANAGARIVLHEGVAGFSKTECRDIASSILLHQKRYEKRLRHLLIRDLPQNGRAFKLAAILRVADGLDHGHIQNVSISSVRPAQSEIRVKLTGECYQRNAPSAAAKADLWRRVFPYPIAFDSRPPRSSSPRLAGVLGPHHSALETARRLLCVHYRIIEDNCRGAMAAVRPEPLHDIRVAIRRLCAALRVFRQHLKCTSAQALIRRFSRVNSALGPIRDSDVWATNLRDKKFGARLAHERTWTVYLAYQRAVRKQNMKTLRRLLRSRRFASLMESAERFGRIELPALMRQQQATRVQPFATEQLREHLSRIVEHEDVDAETDPEDLHELRKLCRRGRYYAEFFTPALGAPAAEMTARFKSLADSLGRIHDTDVALERIQKDPVTPPKKLKKTLLRLREKGWKDFEAAWRALRRRKCQKRMMRRLQ